MEEGIKLIVGLGNPGSQYENTRHNAGFWLAKDLAEKYNGNFKLEPKFRGLIGSISISNHKCDLLLPETFMNLSGEAVSKIAKFYKFFPQSILVVHDELDFSPGVIRLKKGGGANGHNGVQNIIDHLGDNDFWRMRVGIGKPKIREEASDYVLHTPSKLEFTQIHDAVDRALTIIPDMIVGNFAKAMLELHKV